MGNYILKSGGGDRFQDVAEQAKRIATSRSEIVEFDFNGIKCLVDKETNLECLWNHYKDAHIMKWETIGPDCAWEYDVDTKIELYSRRLKQAQELKVKQAEWKKKDNEQKEDVAAKVGTSEIEIIPGKEQEYKDYVETNSKDGYSRGVVDYAEAWAKLMQIEIAAGKSVKDCAEETQKGLGYLGITGFMYGCAVNALSHFWKHGENLRRWHNKEYGHEGDGVVNPAILTISK